MIDTSIYFTPQERKVFSIIMEGKSSAETAATLNVSKRTIDFHLQNIYDKLGARNRIEAYRYAQERGLL